MAYRDLADSISGLSLMPRQSSAVGAYPRPRPCRHRDQPFDRNLNPDPSSHSGGGGLVLLPPSPVPVALRIPDDEWVIVSHSDGIESSPASTEAAAAATDSSKTIGKPAAGMAMTTGVEAATNRPSTAIHGPARAAPRPPPSRGNYYQPLTAALLDEFNRRLAMEAKYRDQQERIRSNANMAPERWDHFGDGPSRAATDTLDDDWVVPPSPAGFYVFGVGGRFLPYGAAESLIVEPDLELEQA